METITQLDTTEASRVRWGNLAGRPHGDRGAPGRAFVFLHGLTFDHRMWDPVLDALPPSHRAVAFDLPGHGGSRALPRHDLEAVADTIHDAVIDDGLEAPIVVGHSIGAPIASLYAVKYPAAAVVAIEAPVMVAPFARSCPHSSHGSLRSASRRRGGCSARACRWILSRRALVPCSGPATGPRASRCWATGSSSSREPRRNCRPGSTSRWSWRAPLPCRISRCAGAPWIPRNGHLLHERMPHAEIVVWPVGHHFPHLADPTRFAELLISLAAGVPVS